MSSENKKKLLEQLAALKIFPNSKLVRELRRQIKKRLEKLETKLAVIETATIETIVESNLSRASKLKKYHHYIRLIKDNFPELEYSTIRKQFSERKQGNEVSIPDAIWQNPSP